MPLAEVRVELRPLVLVLIMSLDLHQQFETLNPKVKYKAVSNCPCCVGCACDMNHRLNIVPRSVYRRHQEELHQHEENYQGRACGLLL